jgi:hypothetical protein
MVRFGYALSSEEHRPADPSGLAERQPVAAGR